MPICRPIEALYSVKVDSKMTPWLATTGIFLVHRFWSVGFMVSDMLLRRWFFFLMLLWVLFLWLWVDFLEQFWADFGGCSGSRSRLWVVVVGYVQWWLTGVVADCIFCFWFLCYFYGWNILFYCVFYFILLRWKLESEEVK